MLDVSFVNEEHSSGYQMLAETHATWRLTRRSNNALLWERAIHTTGEKTAFGLASPESYLVLAEEESVKDNIRTAIQWLQKVNMGKD
jgi:hypothetical protein